MSGGDDPYISASKTALESIGFEVYVDCTVEGLSGLKHSFDIIARRSNRMVYISLRNPNPMELLIETAKSMDVRGEFLVAILGDLPQELPLKFNGQRFKMLPVKSPEELAIRLKKLLAENDAPSSSLARWEEPR